MCAQSCSILCNPRDYSLPGSSVHGIFLARILEWVAISSSRDLSYPGKPCRLSLLHWHANSLPSHLRRCFLEEVTLKLRLVLVWVFQKSRSNKKVDRQINDRQIDRQIMKNRLTQLQMLRNPTICSQKAADIGELMVCCHCRQVTSVMSNSVQPHRRQPTRLPDPWDSPGKNTGLGCHFLLQCMKVKSENEVAQSSNSS